MSQTRRELLGKSRWAMTLPLLSLLPSHLLAEQAMDLTRIENSLTGHFRKLGYAPLPALDLITGESFNAGLRYDESFDGAYPSGNTMRIQNCARIEDLSKSGQPGVLTYFHIVIFNMEAPQFRGELLSQLLGYLVNPMGLDLAQMVLVSTDKFRPYLQQLKRSGITPSQFLERPRSDAVAAGDGSGYFSPKGHPHVSGFDTVSIHYPLPGGNSQQPIEYPLRDYLELGEIILRDETDEGVQTETGGFGLERLLMAADKPADNFASSREKALTALQAESKARKVALPPGYSLIESA